MCASRSLGSGSGLNSAFFIGFGLFVLAFVSPLISAAGAATGDSSAAITALKPTVKIVIDNDAEWRAPQWVEFDDHGNVIILYRDRKENTPGGNWHVLKITDLLSDAPHRQIVNFAPIEELSDPDEGRKWDTADGLLRVNREGTFGYVVLDGAVTTRKAGPSATNGLRNVETRFFTNAVAIDLEHTRVLASRDLSGELDSARSFVIDADGDLLALKTAEASWIVSELGPQLKRQSFEQLAAPKGIAIENCSPESRDVVQCNRGGDVVRWGRNGASDFLKLGENSTFNGNILRSLDGWIISAYTLNSERFITDNRLWKFSPAGTIESSSKTLVPQCAQGWASSVVSGDGMSLLISCFETSNFLDMFYGTSRTDLQLVDAITLQPRASLKLSTRSVNRYAVWHGKGQTIIAVLEDGRNLVLYRVADHVY